MFILNVLRFDKHMVRPGFLKDHYKMEDEKVSALDERLTQLERRIFGTAEKDAEYPKVCRMSL